MSTNATRHLLHPAKLTVELVRREHDTGDWDRDRLGVYVWRDELLLAEVALERGESPLSFVHAQEDLFSLNEQAQIVAAIAAEWLAWPGEPELPMGTIEEVLERLKGAVEGTGAR